MNLNLEGATAIVETMSGQTKKKALRAEDDRQSAEQRLASILTSHLEGLSPPRRKAAMERAAEVISSCASVSKPASRRRIRTTP